MKQLKKAWTADGCDLQVGIEKALTGYGADIVSFVEQCVKNRRDQGYEPDAKTVEWVLVELREEGLL